MVNINLVNNKEIAKLINTNELGEVVKTKIINVENTRIFIEKLINGIYFVTIKTKNRLTTKSLVKK